MDYLHLQKVLYEKFKFIAPLQPTQPEESLVLMRLNFLLEELKELYLAQGWQLKASIDITKRLKTNPEQTLDALVDLLVVLLGTVYMFGLAQPMEQSFNCYFDEAFFRVWKKNMEKERVKTAEESSRGHIMDLKKPAGWTPPVLQDLVKSMEVIE